MDNFIGEIRLFAGNYVPQDWHLCDGSVLAINGNEALFALLGTRYGGDGVTNFALPDLRGRTAIHCGQGAGLATNYQMGQTFGQQTVALTAKNLPAHSHQAKASKMPANSDSPAGQYFATTATGSAYTAETTTPPATVSLNAATISASPGGAVHSNMQPYIALTYIIALTGEFPSQS